MAIRAYFFGCWSRSGHFLFDTNGRNMERRVREQVLPWDKIDGFLQPHWQHVYGYYEDEKPCWKYRDRTGSDNYRTTDHQGESLLHFKDGWNLLAMWDSSVDSRTGCNANFIFYDDGRQIPFEEMVELARTHFPSVVGRFPFEIKLVEGCEAGS